VCASTKPSGSFKQWKYPRRSKALADALKDLPLAWNAPFFLESGMRYAVKQIASPNVRTWTMILIIAEVATVE
jgi:hypothetical protein